MKKAILLSGGMDSIALTYWFRHEIDIAITIDYGQKSAKKEIEVSRKICNELQIKHDIIEIDCSSIGSGEMCDKTTIQSDSSPEWWPFRNQLLITLTCMKIISYGIKTLLFGAVKGDDKFVDGSMPFFKTISKLTTLQEGNIEIITPASSITTKELIRKSNIPDEILLWAHSCHAGYLPCGVCNGCLKYISVIEELRKDHDGFK